MKTPQPYPTIEEENSLLTAQEPAATYATEAAVIPEDLPYADIENGVLQVTPDIEEDIAAVDRGETVTMNEFKTMFSRWL